MPRFDGTGPLGAGPRTGWGRGYCAPGASQRAASDNVGVLRGLGRGGIPWGGGRGRCLGGRGWLGRAGSGYAPQQTAPDEELDRLREELAKAQKTVQEMEARLAELEKSS